MSNKIYNLSGQLQNVYKVLSSLLLIIILCFSGYKLYQKDYDGIIILGIWVIILAFIFLKMIKTADIKFDDEKVYINRGFMKIKKSEYRLDQIKKIKTSFSGYFTTISLFDGPKRNYSCFNTTVSALKHNRTDLFKLNRTIIKNSDPESDTVEILRKKVRAVKGSTY